MRNQHSPAFFVTPLAFVVAAALFAGCGGGIPAGTQPHANLALRAPAASAIAYADDAAGNLWTIDLRSYVVHKIGNAGHKIVLGALAIDPKTHVLYGVAPGPKPGTTSVYTVSTNSGAATKVCDLKVGDAAGGMAFNSAGSAYIYDNATSKLSAKTGTVRKAWALNVDYFFALFGSGAGPLYGISTNPKTGTTALYLLKPDAPLAQRTTLLRDYGAAIEGGFQSAAYAAQ